MLAALSPVGGNVRSLFAIAAASSIFFSLACATAPAVPPAADPDAPSPTPPRTALDRFSDQLRLPDVARPLAYALTFRIDPAAPTFSGEVAIEVDLAEPLHTLRLHADGLTITRAAATIGATTRPLETAIADTQLAVFDPAAALPAGPLVLHLAWTGPLPEAPVGIYRVNEGGRWYVFTQFEPLEARRAFPSFDEPRFKTPYTTTIEVPAGQTAFSNYPERASGAAATPGWTRFEFEPTPPMPTYLVALAVGELDVVVGERVSSGKVPFRILAPKGKGHLAGFALDKTPRHLDWQERWFGSPLPYAKLDFVAVPSFSSSGMENVGLVTYREALLLLDGDRAAIEDRLWCEGVIAHELAHMWFGNLVTMSWWDELWLNEAFAVWMGRKSLAAVSPELDIAEQNHRSKFYIMQQDARVHARAVRQPIASDGDIYNAFDGITYGKGAAVLRMIEQWIGPERFQAGVRAYLAANAHGTGTTAELLEHLGREGQRDVAPVVASFVDQPGVPMVDFDWRCEPDGVVTLDVRQRPHRALGDPRPAEGQTWRIPVCALLSDGRSRHEHCELLSETAASWRVDVGFCPTFAHPNVGEAGYYRWRTRLGPISIARADKSAFAGWVASLTAGVEDGSRPLAELVDGIEPLFEASVSPSELQDLVGALGHVARFDRDAPYDARFQKKARALLDRIPLDLSLGDSASERRRMPILVRALAGLTRDARVFAHAKKVGDAFLKAIEGARIKAPPSPEAAAIYLPLMVHGLGREARAHKQRAALWQRLRAAFDKVRDPTERDLVIEALASFDDPALATKTFDLLLDGTLRSQDLRTVRARTSGRREVASAVWDWLTTHFDAVVDKLGAKAAPSLPGFASSFCEEGDAERVAEFFAYRRAALPSGIDRPLAQTLEGIRACIVARARYHDEARAWYTAR